MLKMVSMGRESDNSHQFPSRLRFTPSLRFQRVQEMVVHSRHRHPLLFSHRSLKILSWNIAKQNQTPLWQQDFQTLLVRHQPDLVFLQEVKLCALTQHLPGLGDLNWQFAPNFIDGHASAYAGILTAAKATHQAAQSMLSQEHEPITNTPKISLLTRYDLPGSAKSLLAVNTHMINFVELPAFCSQLQKLATVIAAHRGPVIFSGDFNTWSQSRWRVLSQITEQLQLQPVRFSDRDTRKIKRFLLSPPLDYIFYRDLIIKPLSPQVFDQITSSDHKPIFVELAWQG
jgi:endonuclease/exonuclease/phosphatase (EEP) superfamily protein YafD